MQVADMYEDKDANMINKLLAVSAHDQTWNFFTKFSDDMILLKPYHLEREWPKYFCPMAETLERLPEENDGEKRWKKKFERTIDLLNNYGVDDPLNFDTHTPQPYPVGEFNKLASIHDYTDGYVINSLFINLINNLDLNLMPFKSKITTNPKNPNRMAAIKGPIFWREKDWNERMAGIKFLETDNAAFALGNLEEHLQRLFPDVSRWEKEVSRFKELKK